jgi:creatinine amidohydrolase
METDRKFIEHLPWDEVAGRIENGAAAILPVGAGAKQHGFHLPMNTDRIQAEWLAAQIADRIDAVVWPTVSYGYYPAFVDYAGSSTLSAPTFESLIEELTAGILGYGCGALFVLDTGISTIAPIDRALVGSPNALHLKIHDGPRYRRAATQLTEQSHGSHADELETSRMLVLAPHLVNMARAEASPPRRRETPGNLTRSDPASPNYSRSGSFGNPTLATRAKGEILLKAMVDDMVEQATAFMTGKSDSLRSLQR